jgi:hypothetical protein
MILKTLTKTIKILELIVIMNGIEERLLNVLKRKKKLIIPNIILVMIT